jgi:large subunit ribosomal protein L25
MREYKMTKIKLNGSVREDFGSAVSKRLRKQGQLPCVIYNKKGENIYLSVEAKDFNKYYMQGNIQIKPIEITTKDKTYNVLVYDFALDPVKDTPIHVDFLNLEDKKEIKVFIPLDIKEAEKSPGLKKGGFLNLIYRKIQLWCSPENIPTKISINIGKLNMGETLKIDKIKLPNGTRTVDKTNFVVLSITGRGKNIEETTSVVTAVTPEGAPVAAAVEAQSEAKGGANPEVKTETKKK